MSKKLLLPHRYKRIGWFILIPATILGVILTVNGDSPDWLHTKVFALFADEPLGQSRSFAIIDTDITYTIVGALFIIGALLVGFSKEKQEDEFIAGLRLSSLLWAVWVNYVLLLFAFLFIYGLSFLTVMEYNMFTVLIIFIVRFNYILYKNAIAIKDEK
jgi:hypothetical protein